MVRAANAKYTIEEMADLQAKNLSKMKLCEIHGASAMPCRKCEARNGKYHYGSVMDKKKDG